MKLASNGFAVLFICAVSFLTGQYLFYNHHLMKDLYFSALLLTNIAHIVMLIFYVMWPENINTPPRKVFILTLTVMILSCVLKAALQRSIIGGQLIDFPLYVKFNEQWLYPEKFLWHFVLDFTVLITTALFKNSYKLFQK